MTASIRVTTSESVRAYVNASYIAKRDPALMSWAVGLWRGLTDDEKTEVANVREFDRSDRL